LGILSISVGSALGKGYRTPSPLSLLNAPIPPETLAIRAPGEPARVPVRKPP
jgi:hypothetical protein